MAGLGGSLVEVKRRRGRWKYPELFLFLSRHPRAGPGRDEGKKGRKDGKQTCCWFSWSCGFWRPLSVGIRLLGDGLGSSTGEEGMGGAPRHVVRTA